MPRRVAASLLAILLAASPCGVATAQRPVPPVAERRAHVDTMHGDVRPDDYFWLRHKDDPAVRRYLEAENGYADSMLAPLAGLRDTLYREMLARIQQTDLSVPYRRGAWAYYTRTVEGRQYPVYCRKPAPDGAEQVLLDLNEMARGQTFMGLGAYQVSDDGQLLAYSVDTTGFRRYALFVKDLRTGALLPERAARVGSVTWASDNRTLFYTTENDAKRQYRLHRLTLGAGAPAAMLYEETDERFSVSVYRTRSRAWLVMQVGSLTTSESSVLPADRPAEAFRLIAARRADREYDVDHHGDLFYIRVNDTGRNFRLVTAPVADPGEANWREVVPHRAEVMLLGVEPFRNHLVRIERQEGLNRLVVTDLSSRRAHTIPFPEPVYTAFVSVNEEFDTPVLRYSYQSFVTPQSVYDYDMSTRRATLLKRTAVLGGYDPAHYASERVWARARDGTRVPISLVYRRGLRRDGTAPLLLYGYGSYGSSQSVTFNSNRLSLLDRGLVFAIAHIRGGGEMGKPWHDDGRMLRKMNTFTDFIDCAEYLVAQRYAARDRIAAQGGSAGGLLMGAATNLRPDLFRVVVANVPFVDVINTMRDSTLPLTVGEFEEWGNPAIADQYAYIRQYSPYDNLARRDYPSMLVTTSFNDSQVLYHEPAKYVARMRALRTDGNPLVFTINMGAGHGGASGRYDRLREIARDWAFVLWQLGVTGATAVSAN
ncbi:MAG: oligopeptidase B [Gemmatimonadetes bacterium GWC2_71_10]|nr:MAG: oligopeptidase B [Gemmatimonadetes bacterium GWC2_71_10]